MYSDGENRLAHRCWLVVLLWGLAFSARAEPATLPAPIVLATNVSAAFSADTPDVRLSEEALPHIGCILGRLHWPYHLRVMPWRRTYQDVKNNRIDGFFPAIPMQQLEPYAALSAPLLLENWYWFWRADMPAPESWRQGYKLGSIMGSQQETWLREAGYSPDASASNLPQLIKQLKSQRIDGLLADREHFALALAELQLEPEQFSSRFFRYVPLGVYFNEAFLGRHPDFLSHFNQQINRCATLRFQLSDNEREQIRTLLLRKLERWRNLPGLMALLTNYNRQRASWSSAQIARYDSAWIAAFQQQDRAYTQPLVDAGFSVALHEAKQQTQGIVSEIILVDKRGLVVALSDMTSDFVQADEPKYSEVYGKPADTLHLGDISYDESSKRFLVHASVPVNQDHEAMGVLVVGIDVEKALSQRD